MDDVRYPGSGRISSRRWFDEDVYANFALLGAVRPVASSLLRGIYCMVTNVALYTTVHQPRRLKLPAQPIPRCASVDDIIRCLFDERLDEQYFRRVAQSSYYPAARLFLDLVQKQGLRLAISFSLSFIQQAMRWEPALIDLFRELVSQEEVEIVGIEPYHSLHCLIDLPGFVMRMRWMANEIERIFGKRPKVTDTTRMCMSTSIYDALDTAGFRGIFMDYHPQVMQWRSSNYLYSYGDEKPCAIDIKLPTRARRSTAKTSERDRLGAPYTSEATYTRVPYLLTRHTELSADVETRFSHTSRPGFPLYADKYASWVAETEGDFVVLGWNFETFGERYSQTTGIFEFMQALPKEFERHGITTRTPGELIDLFSAQHTYNLPLPLQPASLSRSTNPGTYLEYEPQNALFQLMNDVYNLAKLTENPELLDIAIWLSQADNFRFVQWPGPYMATSDTPQEWWHLGAAGLLHEQQQVYINTMYALEPHLPAHALRTQRAVGNKFPRGKRATASLEASQAFNVMARRS